MGCYIWYSEEGTGRGRSPPRPLLAVPNAGLLGLGLGLGLEAKFSGLGLGLEAFGLGLGQGQSDQYSSKHSVSQYNYTYSTLVYQRHWYHHSAITI